MLNYNKNLIKLALEEDIGSGDITSDVVIPENLKGKGVYFGKRRGAHLRLRSGKNGF